jgi:hypothetical protein
MFVSGTGVDAQVVDYHRVMSNQNVQRHAGEPASVAARAKERERRKRPPLDETTQKIMARIQERLDGWENFPANRALANLVFVEVTVAPDAEPGPREIRLGTLSGVSNPLTFYVGQLPEVARPAMRTARMPVLGNEEAAERRRPPEEAEQRITVPCVANGQVAAGEVNYYRFQAGKGQRLVIAAQARKLQPYIADAVPGWFQTVLTLYDAQGREVAYNDDFRFKPDSVIYYEVPEDGQYVVTISDALFRGREDWVYRLTIAEALLDGGLSVGRAGRRAADGRNVRLEPGRIAVGAAADQCRTGRVSRRRFRQHRVQPGAVRPGHPAGTHRAGAQQQPVASGKDRVAGDCQRAHRPTGRLGRVPIRRPRGPDRVAEVIARRLDSPLDSLLKLTDADGNLLALNDDYEDPGTG